MWGVTFAIPVLSALVNVIMVTSHGFLVNFKFWAMQDVMSETGDAVTGGLALAGICMFFALLSASLVVFVEPSCAGSGIPEAKGFLNGNSVPDLFKLRSFVVRVVGIVLSTAAGLPIGREGPMVCIGGTIGYAAMHIAALPFVRSYVQLDIENRAAGEEGASPAMIVAEERFHYAKRIGCVLGAATGIATAFNAPIGGLLYMFEEVSVSQWSQELTFRAFVCTELSTMFCRGLFNIMGNDVHRLLIYGDESASGGHREWFWLDVPFVTALAACIGLLAAATTHIFGAVWRWRRSLTNKVRKTRWQIALRLSQAVLCAFIVAMVFALVPSLTACVDNDHGGGGSAASTAGDDHHRLLAAGAEEVASAAAAAAAAGSSDGGGSGARSRRLSASLDIVQYLCPEGQHNQAATLLLAAPEGAVKHLWARDTGSMSVWDLGLACGAYWLLALAMPGLPLPMGSFVPSMMVGALAGRLFGEAAAALDLGLGLADPGVYSLAGSAAMLGGFTHMTIAIVTLLVESAYDLSLVPMLMLAIFVARLVAKAATTHGYDELLVLAKGVPFLEDEVPPILDSAQVTALDLCDEMPRHAWLRPCCSVEEIETALEAGPFVHFPIIEDRRCIGTTTRSRLESAVRAQRSRFMSHTSAAPSQTLGAFGSMAQLDKDIGMDKLIYKYCRQPTSALLTSPGSFQLPLKHLMDAAPYTLLANMPVPRLYTLFTKSGIQAACVVNIRGEFLGILDRSTLIFHTHRHELPQTSALHTGFRSTPPVSRTHSRTSSRNPSKQSNMVSNSPAARQFGGTWSSRDSFHMNLPPQLEEQPGDSGVTTPSTSAQPCTPAATAAACQAVAPLSMQQVLAAGDFPQESPDRQALHEPSLIVVPSKEHAQADDNASTAGASSSRRGHEDSEFTGGARSRTASTASNVSRRSDPEPANCGLALNTLAVDRGRAASLSRHDSKGSSVQLSPVGEEEDRDELPGMPFLV
eukprot:TRINITY_DN28183_c0_g1_i1.p1 TRINITY_DN28183_c0_g1~~TRINITY_DN28183_c0_g1_i1.p1  ORF type:complete len:1124 (+),score=262.55 TRINITY_DN28183_c0_g1_i1:442-3372(+)